MATKTLLTPMDGTPKQIVFADHAGDFSPTAANDLRITTDGSQELDVQLSLVGVANTEARQSAKFDFGAHWAPAYRVRAAFEMAATPTAGLAIELFLAGSHHATAAIGNPANLTGSDADYVGYSANLADSVKQLGLPRLFICTVQITTVVQVAICGIFFPKNRYGILVVKDESGAAFHSDDVECHVVLDPILPEFQN